ncbi:MAG: hydrogenase maturation protease [Candidatus Omnitrophica bacterium]|nr:hydrogenase maturation protease [Candidatus Omnitrophota bacterium]
MRRMLMDITPDYCKCKTLILGCGNILFGDDGFGPRVVERLQKKMSLPADTVAINTGSGVRGILFDIVLSEKKPKRIIIVDAIDDGRKPGEVFEISIEDIPKKKIDDFSLHQLPTSNLLKELRDICDIEVAIIVSQVEDIPEIANMTLSRQVSIAISMACKIIMRKLEP